MGIAFMMAAVNISETSVNFNITAWRNILAGCHVHTRHLENLKSHKSKQITS
jgi:hypothetical protein